MQELKLFEGASCGKMCCDIDSSGWGEAVLGRAGRAGGWWVGGVLEGVAGRPGGGGGGGDLGSSGVRGIAADQVGWQSGVVGWGWLGWMDDV